MSTITALFIDPEKYLERYAPELDTPSNRDILRGEYGYARGVEVYFGSVVIAHWMVSNAYYDEYRGDPEELDQRRSEVLDEIVGAALKRVLGSGLSDFYGQTDIEKMFGGR